MRSSTLRLLTVGAAACAVVLPAVGQAPPPDVREAGAPPSIFVPRDTIIPVVLENDLTVREAREGDRFTAHVEGDRELPSHTRLIGRVMRMWGGPRGIRADLEFTDLILPDGSRHRIDALPCSLDDRYVRHLDDGRIVVRGNSGAGDVFGGAVGGFIIGSAFRRPILGSFVGAIVGSIAAHNDRANERLLAKGDKVGALFERDTNLDSYPDRQDRPRRGGSFDRVYGLEGTPPPPPPVRDYDDRDREAPPAPAGPPPPAGEFVAVTFEGKRLEFDAGTQPYREGGATMVPLQRAATQLGLTVERGKDNVIYIEGEESSVRLEQDSTEARLNGHKVTLSASVVDRNGVLYAPAEILAAMKKGNMLVNGHRVKPATSD